MRPAPSPDSDGAGCCARGRRCLLVVRPARATPGGSHRVLRDCSVSAHYPGPRQTRSAPARRERQYRSGHGHGRQPDDRAGLRKEHPPVRRKQSADAHRRRHAGPLQRKAAHCNARSRRDLQHLHAVAVMSDDMSGRPRSRSRSPSEAARREPFGKAWVRISENAKRATRGNSRDGHPSDGVGLPTRQRRTSDSAAYRRHVRLHVRRQGGISRDAASGDVGQSVLRVLRLARTATS